MRTHSVPRNRLSASRPVIVPTGRPLREVIADIHARTQQLHVMDDEISAAIETITRQLVARNITRVISVKLPDGADLAWSRAKKYGYWRFIIRDDDIVTELQSSSREERVEVFTCGAMGKLVDIAMSGGT